MNRRTLTVVAGVVGGIAMATAGALLLNRAPDIDRETSLTELARRDALAPLLDYQAARVHAAGAPPPTRELYISSNDAGTCGLLRPLERFQEADNGMPLIDANGFATSRCMAMRWNPVSQRCLAVLIPMCEISTRRAIVACQTRDSGACQLLRAALPTRTTTGDPSGLTSGDAGYDLATWDGVDETAQGLPDALDGGSL